MAPPKTKSRASQGLAATAATGWRASLRDQVVSDWTGIASGASGGSGGRSGSDAPTGAAAITGACSARMRRQGVHRYSHVSLSGLPPASSTRRSSHDGLVSGSSSKPTRHSLRSG